MSLQIIRSLISDTIRAYEVSEGFLVIIECEIVQENEQIKAGDCERAFPLAARFPPA